MGLCGGKSSSDTYQRDLDSADAAKRAGGDGASSSSPGRAQCGGDGQATLLANLAMETSLRRVRLIQDNVGDVGTYYILQSGRLGQGAFGSVVLATSHETGESRAIKSLSKSRAKDTRVRYRQEILIMKMTDHPNIIKLFETFEDKQHVFLVMELCQGGDLLKHLQTVGSLQDSDAGVVMQQVLRPVSYMHGKRICHRDIKPDNFLFLRNCSQVPLAQNTLKIIDFGFSCTTKDGQMMSTKLGTPVYSSPQVFAGQYDQSCDCWSCGVMFFVMLSGQPPFQGRTDTEVVQNVKRGNYAFKAPVWEGVSFGAKDAIRKLIKFHPHERLSAEQALMHSYIRDAARQEGDLALRLTPSLLMDLRSFCSQHLLRRAALQVVATQLAQEETESLRRAFEALDSRGLGVLTVAELKARMQKHELNDLRVELDQVMKDLSKPSPFNDSDPEDLEIGFTEFLAATLEAKHFQKEGTCKAAFRVFDRDGDGRITAKELMDVLVGPAVPDDLLGASDQAPQDPENMKRLSSRTQKTNEEKLRDSQAPQVEALLALVDANGDGVIDFEEFKLMLLGERISAV